MVKHWRGEHIFYCTRSREGTKKKNRKIVFDSVASVCAHGGQKGFINLLHKILMLFPFTSLHFLLRAFVPLCEQSFLAFSQTDSLHRA